MNISQEARSSSFQQLKPVCIKLSEIALRHNQLDPKEFNKALEALLSRLKILPVLDAKLADYAFFPLSYVIKDADSVPAKSLAIAIQCLELLVKRGWQSSTDVALVRELLFFLTIQIGKAKQDDLQLSILACLDTILQSMNVPISDLFVQKDNIPLAGQLIDTLLDIVKDSIAIEIQTSGVIVLSKLISTLNNEELLRMFLPGLVSKLSNILRPQIRRAYKVLVSSIEILELLIRKTLADLISRKAIDTEDDSWRKATSSQFLLALANVIPRRHHDRTEVLEALTGLCTAILDDCQLTLENCRLLALETLCVIGSQNQALAKATLDRLVTKEVINTALQELVYKWLQSLPRRFQSSDSLQAEQWVALVCEGYRALKDSDIQIASLNTELLQTINAGAQLLLNDAKSSKQIDDLPDLTVRDLVVTNPASQIKTLGSLAAPYLRSLEKLIILANSSHIHAGEELYTNDSSLASLWILTRTLSNQIQADEGLQEFVQDTSIPEQFLDIALNRALNILTDDANDEDWRPQALAIELITLIAKQERENFRISLVDALFPLVELVGATNPFLRQYAITSLNAVSIHCGYTGPGDMIVQNVDYLVNAVALKFNSFNVSPQAVQVLIIMLELSGPALIPYLDDLVDSIFGALAAYHGYPRLVEVMFSALAAIVKHGSSGASSIMTAPRIEHHKKTSKLTEIKDIPGIINKIKYPPPAEDVDLNEPEDEGEAMTQTTTPSTELDKVEKPPKTYTMVESVLRLSQHYLTHQEPYLRQKLLELVTVGCNSLSPNEELFLPLVNDIWPVVMQRLYDTEAIVSLAAMQTLSAMFIGAGDFVATRIQNEWPQIRSLFRTVEDKAKVERRGKAGRVIFSYTEKLFEGLIDMLVQFMLHVRIKSSIEDDLFEMLGHLAESRVEVREALDTLNSDALWLIIDLPACVRPTPKMEGFTFVNIPAV